MRCKRFDSLQKQEEQLPAGKTSARMAASARARAHHQFTKNDADAETMTTRAPVVCPAEEQANPTAPATHIL
jgi:hypothetical protein